MSHCEQTVAIAVIGVTGSGKSTFINLASGSNLPVSNPRKSTTQLESSTFAFEGRTVTLIDTPGFNDASPSVLNVLMLISEHFSGLYKQGVKLAGVIYMHCTPDDHMGGPSRHNFLTFRKFCGDATLRDVLIVSHKQPGKEPHDDTVGAQECPHRDEFFKPAVDKGARMLCHDGSQASAHTILRHLINRGSGTPPSRGEVTDQKSDPTNISTSTHASTTTTAHSDANAARELAGQVEHHTKVFGQLCQDIDAATAARDKETKEALQERAKNSLENIERIRHDLEHVVTNLATENSRLEDENRRCKVDFSAQRAEAELRMRLLEEERKARELIEVERGRVELKLAEERALWERRRMDGESWRARVRPKAQYNNFFVCGAIVFALVCASRFAFNGFMFLPM